MRNDARDPKSPWNVLGAWVLVAINVVIAVGSVISSVRQPDWTWPGLAGGIVSLSVAAILARDTTSLTQAASTDDAWR